MTKPPAEEKATAAQGVTTEPQTAAAGFIENDGERALYLSKSGNHRLRGEGAPHVSKAGNHGRHRRLHGQGPYARKASTLHTISAMTKPASASAVLIVFAAAVVVSGTVLMACAMALVRLELGGRVGGVRWRCGGASGGGAGVAERGGEG